MCFSPRSLLKPSLIVLSQLVSVEIIILFLIFKIFKIKSDQWNTGFRLMF